MKKKSEQKLLHVAVLQVFFHNVAAISDVHICTLKSIYLYLYNIYPYSINSFVYHEVRTAAHLSEKIFCTSNIDYFTTQKSTNFVHSGGTAWSPFPRQFLFSFFVVVCLFFFHFSPQSTCSFCPIKTQFRKTKAFTS